MRGANAQEHNFVRAFNVQTGSQLKKENVLILDICAHMVEEYAINSIVSSPGPYVSILCYIGFKNIESKIVNTFLPMSFSI